MSIQEAIQAVKTYVNEGSTPEDAVDYAAEDYGMNPVLVRRKFTEQTGYTPEEHRGEAEAREVRARLASEANRAERAEKTKDDVKKSSSVNLKLGFWV